MRGIDTPNRTRGEASLVLELVRYAASETTLTSPDQTRSLRLENFDERQFQWVLHAGWGPLLFRATRDCIQHLRPSWRDALLSADLTAQVRCGDLIDTAKEVIDICRDMKADVILLKGISISDQYYPTAHLRPMADIDVLISKDAYESVESIMLSRGYGRAADHPADEHLHHGAPLFHSERCVWVELHTALYPEGESLLSNGLFSLPHVVAQSVASSFHNKPVRRLSDELQLVYIASSWMRDLTLSQIHPSFLSSLLDAVYLLKASQRTLDWSSLVGWLDNDMAAASLYVTLSYVSRRGLATAPPSILSHLASSQRLVDAFQLRITHAMLDRYLVAGRPWNLVLPPPVPGRYSLRHQLKKRLIPFLVGKARAGRA